MSPDTRAGELNKGRLPQGADVVWVGQNREEGVPGEELRILIEPSPTENAIRTFGIEEPWSDQLPADECSPKEILCKQVSGGDE